MRLRIGDRTVHLDHPAVMGILNVTPDSFSDGGRFLALDDALSQAEKMAAAGADIIDVGGESTRPGARRVPPEEEIDRVLPVIEAVKRELDILVSIDTTKDRVARLAVIEGGADIINDISGLRFSEGMAATAAELNVPVVIMHIQGTPEKMQENPYYSDVIAELKAYFLERVQFALASGIRRGNIIIDPGIGFGKRLQDNIDIVKNLREFRSLGCPVLIGVSRKSFLGKISGESVPRQRDVETAAAQIVALIHGASILRVHDVVAAVKGIRILKALVELEPASFE